MGRGYFSYPLAVDRLLGTETNIDWLIGVAKIAPSQIDYSTLQRLCAENPRIRFADTHRLRPPAGVLARGLKTLTRFLYARALHRVRFSAVSIRNKKAGRYEYLPACNVWWRRGESNSGPRKPPDWHLQAQSLVLSRTLCAQRHARGVLTGSVLACAIPITCAGAFP